MDGSSLPYISATASYEADGDWREVMTEGSSASPPQVEIRFRGFRLLPGARMLLRDGKPVELGSRAFDLLHVLAAARGSVVAKRDIVKQVWPSTVVEESNLRFQIGVLRRALGRDRDLIKTVAGRGYIFAAETPAFATSTLSESPHLSVLRLVEPSAGHEVRQDARDLLLSRLAHSREACEAIHLLRAVLDELWEMTSRGEHAQATAAAGSAAR